VTCDCGREINLAPDSSRGNHQTTPCRCGIKWQWHARGQQATSQGAVRHGPGPCPAGVCPDYDPDAKSLAF